MRLAVGIITWQDGLPMLEQTIASLDGIADELLIADGAITGIDLQGLPVTSELEDLVWLSRGNRPLPTALSAHEWPSQSAKRTWLLQKARQLQCDWLLQIDADERLHGAAKLKAWLPTWAYDAFPLPFQVEPDQLLCATWKCLKVGAWSEVVAGGAYIRHASGEVVCVVPPDGRPPAQAKTFLPWISHHPDERPEGRRSIRLGELEEILEPPPLGAREWESPGLSPAPLIASATVTDAPTTPAPFFCDQCGTKFAGPGICENGHEPAEVKPTGEPLDTVEEPSADGAAVPVAAGSELGGTEPAPVTPGDTQAADAADSDAITSDVVQSAATPSEQLAHIVATLEAARDAVEYALRKLTA